MLIASAKNLTIAEIAQKLRIAAAIGCDARLSVPFSLTQPMAQLIEAGIETQAILTKNLDEMSTIWTAMELARSEILALGADVTYRLKCTTICAAFCFACLIATWGLLQS